MGLITTYLRQLKIAINSEIEPQEANYKIIPETSVMDMELHIKSDDKDRDRIVIRTDDVEQK